LEQWLNEKGMNKTKQGGYEYKTPAGAVAPTTQVNAPVAPTAQVQPMVPMAPSAVSPEVAPQPQVDFGPPPDIGDKILNDNWYEPVSDLSNKTDFNPVAQQTGYNQTLNTGNEYQQAPGYGKLAKTVQTMFGMG